MEHKELDKEYYVMSADGANNHPLLAWGKTKFGPFLKAKPVDAEAFDLPLNIIFDEPYPQNYEMADLHMLATCNAISKRFKELLEKFNIYGLQFVPIEIKSNKGELIQDYYAFHIWNKISAIDKNNYDGDEPDEMMDGLIFSLQRFSLDINVINDIALEKRLIFPLLEHDIVVLVHKTIYEAIQASGLTGMKFFRVDDWDEDAMFR